MGSGGENAPSGAKQTAVKTIQVKEMEFRLNPAEITLNKPGTYVFCPSLTEGLRLFNTGVRASV
jgi:hypothetical protein